jgi:2-aminoadipate transaminase
METFDTSNINYGQYVVSDGPTCVNLGVGQPRNDSLALDDFNKALVELSQKKNYSLLQYGKIDGYDEYRICLADYLSKQYKFLVNKEELLVTNGITGALTMLVSLFRGKNTKIVCEDPTYFLALNIFKDFGFDSIIKIKTDCDGICVEDLNKIKIESDQTYLMYLIPFNQNPSSATISQSRIKKLVEFLDKNPNFIVFSDEVYNLLGFDGNINVPLYKYHKNIISMNSFSKIFAPSLRLGWLSCSDTFMTKIKNSGQLDSSGCVNPISCAIMHELIISSALQKSIDKWRTILKKNSDTLYALLVDKVKDHILDISNPNGGYFIWLKVKYDTEELSKIMDKYKIKFHHGKKFSSQPDASNCLRLSFSWYIHDDYVLFVDRFKQMLDDFKEYSKVKVHILGHEGKLGKLIQNKILESDNLSYVGGLGRDINLNMIDVSRQNIIVDVSSPEGTLKLVRKMIDNNIHIPLIIGTTGNLPMELIKEYSSTSPVFVCSNFSVGISQFKKILSTIDKTMWKASMIEKHHIHKKDSPSGTAKTLLNLYNGQGQGQGQGQAEFLKLDQIVSIREGEIIGEHELILEGLGETLKISHVANSRDLFASGCVKLIERINKQKIACGLYDYDSVLE